MNKGRIVAGTITALVLGLVGVLVADILPLPEPTTRLQTKMLYGTLGALISLLIFGRLASWTVRTATRLMRQLAARIANEIINQFTRAASRGWSIFPGPTSPLSNRANDGVQWDVDPEGGYLRSARPIILDTSSIIDGRVLDIAKTGFLSGLLIIPDFVLTELQQVADSSDTIKRVRGRKGFEIISSLKKTKGVRVEVWDKEVIGKTVDEKIIRLAKILGGRIMTCDYNLNRVAQISNLTILNFNDLSNALKSLYLPGEKLEVKLVTEGKESGQGVGYLMDGTMVVVQDGASFLGQTVHVEVSKVLQVSAGRMVFGKKI